MINKKSVPPLVSIIIPVYNRPVEFEWALKSAFVQDYENIEIIVVDDGSQDDIKGIYLKYKDQSPFPIKYIRQKNMGVGGARRTGVELANGKYIQHLDADDTISPNKISKQVAALEANPTAVVCICGAQNQKYSTDLLELALNSVPWCTSDPLWRYPNKEIAKWPPFVGGSDIVHFINIGLHKREIVWIKEKLTQIYPSPNSHSKLSKIGEKRCERLKDNYAFPIHIYELLETWGLLSEKKYSEKIAERLYRIAFQFAMIGKNKSALSLLGYSFRASQMIKKKFEICLAYLSILFSRSRLPFLYILLFKIHRKINPKNLHADKYITTLMP